jgi:hypothetical protein
VTQNQFDMALLDIIEDTPRGKKVDMHAAMHTLQDKGLPREPGLWTSRLDAFTLGFPISARKLRRRADRSPRAKRSTNYRQATLAYLRRFPDKYSRLVATLVATDGRITVAQLKLAAGIRFNANFNNTVGKVLRRAVPTERWKLRVGVTLTVEV